MRRHPVSTVILSLCLLGALPRAVLADPPAADCALSGTAASVISTAPDCSVLTCDVMVDPSGTIVVPFEAIRVGDAFSSPDPEWPRFFFDETGNRFHTRLFSQIYNNGGVNVPSGKVTVSFSVKPDATGIADTGGSFTSLGDYVLDIPASGGPFSGYLTAGGFHQQTEPVCWILSPGTNFPNRFLLKVETSWLQDDGVTPWDEDTGNDVRYRFYDFGAEQPPADIAFAIDLSGSMNATIPSEGVSRLVVAQDRARMFVDEIEPAEGNRLGVFGFSTGMSNKSDFLGVWKRVSPAGTVAAILSDTGVIFPFTELVSSATQSSARLAISGPGVTASGCTPIGQGLLRAKSELLSLVTPIGDDPHHKAIVLFSDGMQNIAPFVKEAPSWPCGTSSLPLIDAEKTFKDNTPTLPVYSVFFGSEGESIWNHQLMLHIQEQTGGDYLYYTVDSLELAAAYFQIRHLVASNALLFLEQEGEVTTPGWDTPVTVHFDSAADVATVAVAWPVSKDIELTVEGRRQGEDDSAWKELSEQPQPGDTSGETAWPHWGLPGLPLHPRPQHYVGAAGGPPPPDDHREHHDHRRADHHRLRPGGLRAQRGGADEGLPRRGALYGRGGAADLRRPALRRSSHRRRHGHGEGDGPGQLFEQRPAPLRRAARRRQLTARFDGARPGRPAAQAGGRCRHHHQPGGRRHPT
jgi:hypothetical protein